jgi:ketosteroid isomerase-like protein
MKRNLVGVFLAVLILGSIASQAMATAPGDAAIRKEVQSFFDSLGAMFDKKDARALADTCVPGATLRYANGVETTIEEWQASAAKEFLNVASMKTKFRVEKVVTSGETRIATYTETHTYTLASEKKHKYHSTSRWSVILTKTPQGWKATHFNEFYEKTTRDGKPVKPDTAAKTKKKK